MSLRTNRPPDFSTIIWSSHRLRDTRKLETKTSGPSFRQGHSDPGNTRRDRKHARWQSGDQRAPNRTCTLCRAYSVCQGKHSGWNNKKRSHHWQFPLNRSWCERMVSSSDCETTLPGPADATPAEKNMIRPFIPLAALSIRPMATEEATPVARAGRSSLFVGHESDHKSEQTR